MVSLLVAWLYFSGPVEHLPSVRHEQHTLLFMPLPLLGVDFPIVRIPQIDPSTAFLRYAGSQCHLNARRFYAIGSIVRATPLDVRTVGENTAWHILKAVPLFDKIIPHMVAHLVDQLAVCVRDFADMRSVDDYFTPVGDGRLCLVHRLGRRP